MLFFRYLSDDGTDAGTKNAKVNGFAVPQYFWIEDSRTFWVNRVIITLEDNGGWTNSNYAGRGPLGNGIFFHLLDSDNNVVLDFMDGVAVQGNSDYGRLCYDVSLLDAGGASGIKFLHARWTFAKAKSLRHEPNGLLVPKGYKFAVLLQDDFSAMSGHWFNAQGEWGA